MSAFHPYSDDDLRSIRRLILAVGASVDEFAGRLRRSADFLQSLSPAQAEIVARQAMAIAADPEDYGDEAELLIVREEVAGIPEAERLRHIARFVIAIRRQYYPRLPEE